MRIEPMHRHAEEHVFRLDGEYWTIAYDGQTVRLRDSAGVRYLAALLRRPREPVPASELRTAVHEHGPTQRGRRRTALGDRERDRVAVTKGVASALARIAAAHPALGAHLETTIRCGYQCRYSPDPRRPIRWVE